MILTMSRFHLYNFGCALATIREICIALLPISTGQLPIKQASTTHSIKDKDKPSV